MTSRQDFPPSPDHFGEYRGHVGAVLHRLQELHPTLIDLSLERLESLLAKLDHPECRLPPVIHVAGTNGKGSTCANLRAIAEAGGLRVHMMTSPHLLDVTERFYLAGEPSTQNQLADILEEIEHVNNGAAITVFEVLTAAGFLLFSRIQADLAIIEVGLGGRFDATNILPTAKACIITSISLDHQAFLGETLHAIAREKAGIIKDHVPVITCQQEEDVQAVLMQEAQRHHASLYCLGREIRVMRNKNSENGEDGFSYHDDLGTLFLPLPALTGEHQISNAALAIAALRLGGVSLPDHAFSGIARTVWPARMQPLTGHLKELLPSEWHLLLDGGHNPGAGDALAHIMAQWRKDAPDQEIHLIVGLKDSKDAAGFLRPLLPYLDSLHAVAEEGQHLAMPVEAIQRSAEEAGGSAATGPTIQAVLRRLAQQAETGKPARVLVCGSLYLAGCALAQDGCHNLYGQTFDEQNHQTDSRGVLP